MAQDVKGQQGPEGRRQRRIAAVHVQAGDEVQAGQVLVEMDETPWLLQLSQAEAQHRVLQVQVDKATLKSPLSGVMPHQG